MNITKDNIIIIYREGDSDSLSVATHYQDAHDLDNSHVIPIACSNTEILPDYNQFYNEVELPISNALIAFSDIYCIVLGYNVPGGFYDDLDIISSTSRISRINHPFYKAKRSFLYDRKLKTTLDVSDINHVYITSRIDAPAIDDAIKMIDNAQFAMDQLTVNGKLMYDPYNSFMPSPLSSIGSNIPSLNYSGGSFPVYGEFDIDWQDYRDSLLATLNNFLRKIDIVLNVTDDSKTKDTIFSYLEYDSFFWGWSVDRGTSSFFKERGSTRLFFYNADFDSAFTIKSTSSGRWSALAVTNDYPTTVGAMSNPTISGFLNPLPFFKCLVAGGTIGEAYLLSNPYYDWTLCLFGDPLVHCNLVFNERGNEDSTYLQNLYQVHDNWRLLTNNMSRSISYYITGSSLVEDSFLNILYSADVATEVDLLYIFYDIINSFLPSNKNMLFSEQVTTLLSIPMYVFPSVIDGSYNKITLAQYLENRNFKISRLLFEVLDNQSSTGSLNTQNSSLSSTVIDTYGNVTPFLLDEGYWEFEFELQDTVGEYTLYTLELEVSSANDFSSIIFDVFSDDIFVDSGVGWFYYNPDTFIWDKIPVTGISSQYVGCKIRFISPSNFYLTRGNIYNFRWRQIVGTNISNWSDTQDIIWS